MSDKLLKRAKERKSPEEKMFQPVEGPKGGYAHGAKT